ncbi:MAG: hypothetical protein R3D60_09085 [Paracoccaceae bacterium]
MSLKTLSLAAWLALAPVPALCEQIGELSLTIGSRAQTRPVTDDLAGVDTWWNVGAVSIHVVGAAGGTILLTFGEDGTGPARYPHLNITAADGSLWQDVDGSMRVQITRADNIPPHFSIAGHFEGRIEPVAGGTSHPVSGRFDVVLPRQNFAPTPGPDAVLDSGPGN